MVQLRTIQAVDYPVVNRLVFQAFQESEHGYNEENDLVKKIRVASDYQPNLEVVAAEESQIVGYGMLSPCKIITATNSIVGLVLAPLAVLPTSQQQGVGTQILRCLEARVDTKTFHFISILGDPGYYQRFGYEPANKWGVSFPLAVPTKFCLLKRLSGTLKQFKNGKLVYPEAFD
ncbi:N-acetyltransferase [Fructilactobacillus hinvesii]|uniref:N-acetyltransferase n=1 Tax=Fructilactobacillus hinvesii TaxID=2940300 RepID=A0ABY5BVT8_9LACO|nr:N-acetyltransferase [Fructilactobacillus hinvesii]USS88381.1 N-acetyltransferase [Fructilactobacillus hinvesii]